MWGRIKSRLALAMIYAILLCLVSGCSTEHENSTIQQPATTPQPTPDQNITQPRGENMKITSSVFKEGEYLPRKYTCQGENINPSLKIEGIPLGTKSLALIIDDPDAPAGLWSHWLVKDIPPDTNQILEASVPGKEVINSWGFSRYSGPCPPSGIHRYFFKIYALRIPSMAAKTMEEFYKEVEKNKIAEAAVMARYRKA